MYTQKEQVIEIEGVIQTNGNEEQFLDSFIDWIESKGWTFGGATTVRDKE